MTRTPIALAAVLAWLPLAALAATPADDKVAGDGPAVPAHLKDEASQTTGTLNVGGKALAYRAEAGILVVYVKDPMDAGPSPDKEGKAAGDSEAPASSAKPSTAEPEAGMSYYAYFLGKEPDPARPITFI